MINFVMKTVIHHGDVLRANNVLLSSCFTCCIFQVADLIITEFFDQGDKERSELKIQPQVKTILT